MEDNKLYSITERKEIINFENNYILSPFIHYFIALIHLIKYVQQEKGKVK